MEQSDCRHGGDSYHVDYRVDDEGREVENLTHADSIPADIGDHDDELAGWIVDLDLADGELINLLASGGEENGFDITHKITATTALQLSDMFKQIAIKAFERAEANKAKQEAVEQERIEFAARQGILPLIRETS